MTVVSPVVSSASSQPSSMPGLDLQSLDLALAFLKEAEPEIYEEFIQAKSLPPLHPESTPHLIEICFDDVIVVSIRQFSDSSERGQEKRSLSFNSNYSPDVLAIYGDKELILLKAKGSILLNRLPETYLKSEWAVYAK